jgi:hypothetical protein
MGLLTSSSAGSGHFPRAAEADLTAYRLRSARSSVASQFLQTEAMDNQSQDKLYSTALQTIGAVAKLPIVRVDREAFIRKHFGDSPHLDVILARGPQAVYTVESLRKKADSLIKNSVTKTSLASFAMGLPGNPAVAIAAGGADVAQYFGFAINLAQQLAYLFGEDELFDDGGDLSDAAQMRVVAYLGAMFGAAGAAALVSHTSKAAGANVGKKVAAQALTKTAWYPLVKKVGALVGKKVTKKTVEKTITKTIPVVGGVISGGLTYATFRPMGRRLADTLVKHLNGDFEDELVLRPDFTAGADATDVEVSEEPEGPTV